MDELPSEIRLEQAAALLGLSPDLLLQRVALGDLPARKRPHGFALRRDDFLAFRELVSRQSGSPRDLKIPVQEALRVLDKLPDIPPEPGDEMPKPL